MHKAWYYAGAVKVGHFEWLIMYTGVKGQKCTKPVSLRIVLGTVLMPQN